MEMEIEQEREWDEAQKIVVSVADLLDAAKIHLRFLAAVDRNRHLYQGPALNKAIYRFGYSISLLRRYRSVFPSIYYFIFI